MKWVINYAPLYVTAGQPQTRCYIESGKVVEPTGATMTVNDIQYWEVSYITRSAAFMGWVYGNYLEELTNEFPPDVVPTTTQTPDPNDPAQDIVFLGGVQFNLCGEFCVAYIAGVPIEDLLAQWEAKSPNVFRRIFPGGHGATTGPGDLQDLLKVYNFTGVDVRTLLRDPIKHDVLLSPGRMAAIANAYQIITGVKIDAVTGNIRGQGVGHWVCIDTVIPDGIGRGWAEFYNPFPNRVQRESWGTFLASSGTPYGLAVQRPVIP